MKNIIVAIAVLIPLAAMSRSAAASGAGLTESADRAEDEAAIRRIVSRLEEGWNKGDGLAFAAPFAEDADYVVINGLRIKGRDAIAAGHQRILSTIYKGTHITSAVLSVRFLRDDVAVIHVEWHLKDGRGNPVREGKATNSMVMTRDGGRWSIVAFQNTAVAPAEK